MGHLLSWVIEVSEDGSEWEAIDERKAQELNGQYVVKTYDYTEQSDHFVRFVRLKQTGRNSGNTTNLRLSQIEFFGKLIQTSEDEV